MEAKNVHNKEKSAGSAPKAAAAKQKLPPQCDEESEYIEAEESEEEECSDADPEQSEKPGAGRRRGVGLTVAGFDPREVGQV